MNKIIIKDGFKEGAITQIVKYALTHGCVGVELELNNLVLRWPEQVPEDYMDQVRREIEQMLD